MKIIDQGKLKLNTSKSVAIDRFLELQHTHTGTDAQLVLSCNRYGDLCIKHSNLWHNYQYARIPSQLNAQIITENGETYVLYYISLNRTKIILGCGALVVTIILGLLLNLFSGINIPSLIMIAGCVLDLILQVYSILNEIDNPYTNSRIYVDALKRYIDAVDNWEK